jgi:hypothetical protein
MSGASAKCLAQRYQRVRSKVSVADGAPPFLRPEKNLREPELGEYPLQIERFVDAEARSRAYL